MTVNELKKLYPKSRIEEKNHKLYIYPNVKCCVETLINGDYLEIKGPNGTLDYIISSKDKDELEIRIKSVLQNNDAEVIISQEQINDYIDTIFKGLY